MINYYKIVLVFGEGMVVPATRAPWCWRGVGSPMKSAPAMLPFVVPGKGTSCLNTVCNLLKMVEVEFARHFTTMI